MIHTVYYTRSYTAWGNPIQYQRGIDFPSEELYLRAKTWLESDPRAAAKWARANYSKQCKGHYSRWAQGRALTVMFRYAIHIHGLEHKAELERQRMAEIDRIGQEIEAQ